MERCQGRTLRSFAGCRVLDLREELSLSSDGESGELEESGVKDEGDEEASSGDDCSWEGCRRGKSGGMFVVGGGGC